MIWWKTFMVCQSHDSHYLSSKCIFVKIYQVLSNHACHRARVRHRSQLIHHFYWEKIYRNATHMWEKTEKCVFMKKNRETLVAVFYHFYHNFFIFLLKFFFLPFLMLSRGLYFKTWTIYAFTFRHGWVVGVGRYIGQTSGVIYTAEGGNCPAGLRGWHYLDLNLHWQNNGNIAVHCAA